MFSVLISHTMNGWIISVCSVDRPRATDHTCSLPCFCTSPRYVRKMCFLKSKGSQKTSTRSWYQKRRLLAHWQWTGDSTREQSLWTDLWSALTKATSIKESVYFKASVTCVDQWLSEVDGDYYTWCDNLLALTLARKTFVYCFDLPCCFFLSSLWLYCVMFLIVDFLGTFLCVCDHCDLCC